MNSAPARGVGQQMAQSSPMANMSETSIASTTVFARASTAMWSGSMRTGAVRSASTSVTASGRSSRSVSTAIRCSREAMAVRAGRFGRVASRPSYPVEPAARSLPLLPVHACRLKLVGGRQRVECSFHGVPPIVPWLMSGLSSRDGYRDGDHRDGRHRDTGAGNSDDGHALGPGRDAVHDGHVGQHLDVFEREPGEGQACPQLGGGLPAAQVLPCVDHHDPEARGRRRQPAMLAGAQVAPAGAGDTARRSGRVSATLSTFGTGFPAGVPPAGRAVLRLRVIGLSGGAGVAARGSARRCAALSAGAVGAAALPLIPLGGIAAGETRLAPGASLCRRAAPALDAQPRRRPRVVAALGVGTCTLAAVLGTLAAVKEPLSLGCVVSRLVGSTPPDKT